jgi:RNA polymerase sigma factor (TIGR02999 family)
MVEHAPLSSGDALTCAPLSACLPLMEPLIPAQPDALLCAQPGFDAAAHWPALYRELHRLAARLMARERTGHTLSPTGLVHEAWIKLSAGEQPLQPVDRGHFMALSARAMRHILVNHALARQADKRQGASPHLTLSSADDAVSPMAGPEDLLAVDQALLRLAADDARAAQVAEMKVFAGLEVGEIAAALGVSEPTVKRDWVYARARLAQLMA